MDIIVIDVVNEVVFQTMMDSVFDFAFYSGTFRCSVLLLIRAEKSW